MLIYFDVHQSYFLHFVHFFFVSRVFFFFFFFPSMRLARKHEIRLYVWKDMGHTFVKWAKLKSWNKVLRNLIFLLHLFKEKTCGGNKNNYSSKDFFLPLLSLFCFRMITCPVALVWKGSTCFDQKRAQLFEELPNGRFPGFNSQKTAALLSDSLSRLCTKLKLSPWNQKIKVSNICVMTSAPTSAFFFLFL